MPEISVIVPVFNSEKYLNACIDSILSQTFTDFELILVNDGSKDNSGAICNEYSAKDGRVKVIHKENGGVSSARNVGIEKASGRYITFVDSDDIIESDFLLSAITKIGNNGLYLCGMKMESATASDERYIREYGICISGEFTIGELFERIEIEFPQICICGPCCKLFITKILKEKNIRFDENLSIGEDTYFNLEYLKHIDTVYFDSGLYYIYMRYNADSLFSKYKPDIYEVHEKIYDKMRGVIASVTNKTYLENFEKMYAELLMGTIHHVYSHTSNKEERKKILNKVTNNSYIKSTKLCHQKKWSKIILVLIL